MRSRDSRTTTAARRRWGAAGRTCSCRRPRGAWCRSPSSAPWSASSYPPSSRRSATLRTRRSRALSFKEPQTVRGSPMGLRPRAALATDARARARRRRRRRGSSDPRCAARAHRAAASQRLLRRVQPDDRHAVHDDRAGRAEQRRSQCCGTAVRTGGTPVGAHRREPLSMTTCASGSAAVLTWSTARAAGGVAGPRYTRPSRTGNR